MNKRNYNVFFDLHTVSGIVICVGLYIIFFAGAFALFEHEIEVWEESGKVEQALPVYEGRQPTMSSMDYDGVIQKLSDEGYYLPGRSISFMPTGSVGEVSVYMGASQDTLTTDKNKKAAHLHYSALSDKIDSHEDKFSFGTFLVELHYFHQLGEFGYYLAGAISLFFLFAIVTGVLVHWDKIISNFFVFRPWAKLKTLWTDSHTALGIIGLPYQFLYAVSGAYFCLGILAYKPTMLLYDNDPKGYAADFSLWPAFPGGEGSSEVTAINPFISETREKWSDYEPTYVYINNYANDNMHLQIDGRVNIKDGFWGLGTIIYHTPTGNVVKENNPFHGDYADGVSKYAYMLHFAEFDDMLGKTGDLFFRFIYFLLAIITCFVIMSGVLIWLTARDKKSIPLKKKRYNERVGFIYLAVCLSIYPVTAFGFIVSKLLPEQWNADREAILSAVFFGLWLIVSVFFFLKKNNYFTNKYTLLSGGILGLFVPMVNGFYSGNWFWHTFSLRQTEIFIVDFLWIFLSVSTLFAAYRIKRNEPVSHPELKPVISG